MESTFLVDNVFFIIAAMLSGGMLLWPLIARNSAREIDAQRAVRLINYEDALVLDVRDDSEYASGHLPDAKHIPVESIKDRWSELEKFKDKPVVIIFTPGLRAGQAGTLLRKNGFARVFNLSGGIETWQRENLPLVKKSK
ncbi:rhodanese-like domain-containing protein [Nitrosomonas halophila]|uniref:Rhodanese-related sulfurtransferase n=1 Tax=Nitrosomonas halophila TaxID=44576 RepID=A0A1H3G193_9PROT|nr:rhodanese-like domain-containing protein [Nitrosomonas halophila]SDX96174.1 Rhodanese-related sulfurtransferase [Nitrosomonas halophila]HRQ05139.1 rhodanese-like domain-containing protein [Nitrosomonas halophila]